ncbi:unnamed protein product [Phaedon cochleariae]|uniref:Uncharacterized protein n=1 Tax=Phaedon cochleariae TaxID=80249 RepID=A0A9N9SDC2_PHACE|nr:unnamed protein product [Phaedon cochleariae]
MGTVFQDRSDLFLIDHKQLTGRVARRKERLDALAKKSASRKGSFHPIQADISKEEDVLRVFKWTKDNLGPVSILINNAGTFRSGYLSEAKTEDWNTILQLNVVGLSMATREALKVMKENKIKGHIIHINSIAGHHVMNLEGGFAMYIASKHAVTALTESLRMELSTSGHKIKVTSVSPGMVDTEIIPEDFKKTEGYKKAIEEESILLPEDIADGVMYALSTPPRVQDGTPVHTASANIVYLNNRVSYLIEPTMWPPNKPDLHSVDFNVWGTLHERVFTNERNFENLEELKEKIDYCVENATPQLEIARSIQLKQKGDTFRSFQNSLCFDYN